MATVTRVAIAGASGLIGSALTDSLRSQGISVTRLVRRQPAAGDEARWDPSTGTVDPAAIENADAVINLAGAGVGDKRWTAEYKETIRASRVLGTRALVDAMLAAQNPPSVFINGSAQGYYGDRGDEILTEDSAPGAGFLAEVVRDWEAEAARAATASDGAIRVVMARTGLVLSPNGGALAKLLPLVKVGLAGPLANGQQWWSWITLADEVLGIQYLLTEDSVHGPVNFCSPGVARNIEVTKALAHAYGRPAVLPAPGFALKLVLGEFAEDILASIRMEPTVLSESGFTFRHADLQAAVQWVHDAGTR